MTQAVPVDQLTAWLSSLDPKDKKQLEDAALREMGASGIKWVPNPGPQTEAYFSEADILLYGGSAGSGKALEINSLVLTATGWKPIGSLKVGSQICATDGTITKVIGVHPQGARDLYRVTFEDGASVEADLDHIWLAWRPDNGRKKSNKYTNGISSARKWTTREMLEIMSGPGTKGRRGGFITPLCDPVSFNVAGSLKGSKRFIKRPVEPYFLGLLLGDGWIGRRHVSMATADDEIVAFVSSQAHGDVGFTKGNGRAIQCRFRGEFLKKLCADMADIGLSGHLAADKFIPRQYLFAPTPERWAILQGLMDTDGWVEPKKGAYFCTISKRLADDVTHLARSLGGTVFTTDRIPTFTHKGERRIGRRAYYLRLKMPHPERCFRLTRKVKLASAIRHQSLGRRIEKIEYSRRGQAVCISVSHPNSLFITEQFIVTHNSALGLGLAFNEHKNSLIMRRESVQLGALIKEAIAINGTRDGFNGSSPPKLVTKSGKQIDFGHAQNLGDEQAWQGQPHDLLFLDEGCAFMLMQVRFLMGWLRSTDPKQRKRCVIASNPPVDQDGQWLVDMFGPWLDPKHPNPAQPGELRWYVADEKGEDLDVGGPEPREMGGRLVHPMSRTFIPGKLADNPFLAQTDYVKTLDSLPEPYRSAYRDGNFMVARQDGFNQVIPTAWVMAAIARWSPRPDPNIPMCAIGVDPARGGRDDNTIACRFDGWYGPIERVPGVETPAGRSVAGLVVSRRMNDALVIVDMGGGYGTDVYGQLIENQIETEAYLGVDASNERTADGRIGFHNKRSCAYWQFREALDPSQPGGSAIMLPNDAKLISDLTAPTFSVTSRGIAVEPKEDVVKKLGRSPDAGDAVVMAWTNGAKAATQLGGWAENGLKRRARPNVNLGAFGTPLSARGRR